MNELLYTEGDVRFAEATAKSEIERLNKALDFWKNGHMEMTKELSDVRRANDTAVDEYIKSEEKVIALTAEREEDAQRMYMLLKQNVLLTGESGVLRGLLNEALGVLETITDEQEPDDWMLLMALKGKIGAAITPQAETGDLL